MTKRFKLFKSIIGTILILIGLLVIGNIYLPINSNEYVNRNEDLLTLRNYLINDPIYQKGTGKSRTFFGLVLNGYPGANFQNEYEYLQATDWTSAVKDIKYQDTVTIKVLKNNFEKFYLNRNSLSFFQQIIYHPIDRFEFYSLEYNGKEYVNNLFQSAKDYKEERNVISFVIGLMFIGTGIYSLFAKK